MKLSIIVPIYNREKYLNKCIDSILNQTFKDFELILVNDGSTDKSLDICKQYMDKDKRIKVIDLQQNAGVSNARNCGLDIAKGTYIGFVDSDDYIDPKRYEKAINKAEKFKADIVQVNIANETNGKYTPAKNSHNEEGLLKIKVPNYPGSVPVKIIKKSLIDKHNIRFYISSKCGEDTAFMALIYMYNPIIYCINETLYFRVVHDESITSTLKNNDLNIKYNVLYTMVKCKNDLLERKAETKWINRIERYIKNTLNDIETLLKNK